MSQIVCDFFGIANIIFNKELFTLGALYVVQPIVLLDYFGEEYIVEVMGIMMWSYGVSVIMGSPMAGKSLWCILLSATL